MNEVDDAFAEPRRAGRLAIIIPAFKSRFLRDALRSVAWQTDRRFQLYVFDDCSPEPIADVVREFTDTIGIQYHRFETNLGGTSLTRHWDRCVRLTREPWVWVFSDDDVMDEGCVAAFLDELQKTKEDHDVYRFNTVWIDGANTIITESPRHPQNESGADFLMARLQGERNSTLQEQVFSRSAWDAMGGFPDFPLAWASDDAALAAQGVRRPIRTIAGPRVRWRLSDVNITNDKSRAVTREKIKASAEFVLWTIAFFGHLTGGEKAKIERLTEEWFFTAVSRSQQIIDWQTCRSIDRLGQRAWGYAKGYSFLRAFKQNVNLIRKRLRLSAHP
jgi:hypothetical protein